MRDGRERIIGAIETFTDESERTATQARLSELEQLAMVDPLTGAPNRRFLEMTLSSRLADLRRYAVPFVVAFADIDHFKCVNDSYGHDAGDKVRRMVANTLGGNLRGSDTVARFGGEEFVLLLNHAAGTSAIQVCERLNRLVATSSIDGHSGDISVTISFGATVAQPTDSCETVLRRADAPLYQSKQAGRDRVSTDSH